MKECAECTRTLLQIIYFKDWKDLEVGKEETGDLFRKIFFNFFIIEKVETKKNKFLRNKENEFIMKDDSIFFKAYDMELYGNIIS